MADVTCRVSLGRRRDFFVRGVFGSSLGNGQFVSAGVSLRGEVVGGLAPSPQNGDSCTMVKSRPTAESRATPAESSSTTRSFYRAA